AKSNKLKDHKILQIQSQFSSSNKQTSYQELVQNIANEIYNDLQNSI
ncbi:hypothetical protein IY804_04600, partial [Campylobacter volucris]|nr:hypothetical protein [Campylobacter volucris]MBF7047354.1 hypothetical protein [Campylobacter volucris]